MKKLELRYTNVEGRVVTHSIDNPVEPLDPAAVNTVMDQIIAESVFTSNGGELVGKRSARVVDQQIEEIEIFE